MSLAGCIGTIFVIVAGKRKLSYESLRVELERAISGEIWGRRSLIISR